MHQQYNSETYFHIFDQHLYYNEIQIMPNINNSKIIKIPYIHQANWENGDYSMRIFFETVPQMNLVYKHFVPRIRIYEYQFRNEYKKIDYKSAKYLIEKLCRLFREIEHGMPLEFF